MLIRWRHQPYAESEGVWPLLPETVIKNGWHWFPVPCDRTGTRLETQGQRHFLPLLSLEELAAQREAEPFFSSVNPNFNNGYALIKSKVLIIYVVSVYEEKWIAISQEDTPTQLNSLDLWSRRDWCFKVDQVCILVEVVRSQPRIETVSTVTSFPLLNGMGNGYRGIRIFFSPTTNTTTTCKLHLTSTYRLYLFYLKTSGTTWSVNPLS